MSGTWLKALICIVSSSQPPCEAQVLLLPCWQWDDKYQVMAPDSGSRQPKLRAHACDCIALLPSYIFVGDKGVSGRLLFVRIWIISVSISLLGSNSKRGVGFMSPSSTSPPPGERLAVVEVQCERLRMLYRDCARPPPPPLQADRRQVSPLPCLQHAAWENYRMPGSTSMILEGAFAEPFGGISSAVTLSSLNVKAHQLDIPNIARLQQRSRTLQSVNNFCIINNKKEKTFSKF